MKDFDDSGTAGPDPAREPQPDTGQIGNVIHPPTFGPDSPRRLDIDPDSPLAMIASVSCLSTRVQLAEYQALAGLFMAEAISRLNFAANGDERVYQHASFLETVDRFREADEIDIARKSAGSTEARTAETDKAAETDKGSADHVSGTLSEAEDSSAPLPPTEDSPVPESAKSPLPNFPRFRLTQSFNGWVHEVSSREDVVELSAVLGTTIDRTSAKVTTAVTLVHGLPKFLKRCLDGDFTIEHVHVAVNAARNLDFDSIPTLDDYLDRRRADITIETFRKSLNSKIAVLQTNDERLEVASKRRRVDITTYSDGTASVLLSGPAPELKAFHLRLEAFARAVRSGNISAFTDEFAEGAEIIEERSINALMFDICTRTRPQLTIEVTTRDTATGEMATTELDVDVPDRRAVYAAGVINAVRNAADKARAEAEAGAGPEVEVTTNIGLVMPTHGQWIASQAKMITMVPFLTLVDGAELPGIFSDGSPIPAEAARSIAAKCSTWMRILTDPATGTPIDARATSYHIPSDLRLPLAGKWQSCTAPGCIRRGETSEVDHIIPYDHDEPERGGLTTFMNTHPLCRPHHQAKTDRRFSVRMTSDGSVEYMFRHGAVVNVAPPDSPINVEHAELFERRANRHDPPDGEVPPGKHDPPDGVDPPDASDENVSSDRPGRRDGVPPSTEPGQTAEPDQTGGPGQTAEPDPGSSTPKSSRKLSRTSYDRRNGPRSSRTSKRRKPIRWDSDDPPPF